MHDAITDQLSDYLDGELSAGEAAAIDTHLRECADCNAVLNDLKRIIGQAQHLEERPPSTDLWAGIERRLAPTAPPRRVSFTLPQLAAAAALLIAVSAAVAIKVAAPHGVVPAAFEPRAAATATESADVSPIAEPVSFSDAQYDAAVADLEKALKAGRGRLDQSTVAIVEHNLQIIDRAIAQAREALAGDPANAYLSSHLVEARRRKLDLLRRAAALAETN